MLIGHGRIGTAVLNSYSEHLRKIFGIIVPWSVGLSKFLDILELTRRDEVATAHTGQPLTLRPN